MSFHDIGLVLDWLDQQGLTENTIVWYSTDNGPEHASWLMRYHPVPGRKDDHL